MSWFLDFFAGQCTNVTNVGLQMLFLRIYFVLSTPLRKRYWETELIKNVSIVSYNIRCVLVLRATDAPRFLAFIASTFMGSTEEMGTAQPNVKPVWRTNRRSGKPGQRPIGRRA